MDSLLQNMYLCGKDTNVNIDNRQQENGFEYGVKHTGISIIFDQMTQIAFVKVNFDQKDYDLCTYFPGYTYSWTHINNELVEQLIDMLIFMDKYIPKKTSLTAGTLCEIKSVILSNI